MKQRLYKILITKYRHQARRHAARATIIGDLDDTLTSATGMEACRGVCLIFHILACLSCSVRWGSHYGFRGDVRRLCRRARRFIRACTSKCLKSHDFDAHRSAGAFRHNNWWRHHKLERRMRRRSKMANIIFAARNKPRPWRDTIRSMLL